ncbi:MAG: hypothetical protein R3Y50_09250 [Rikenellaceae bacterium]
MKQKITLKKSFFALFVTVISCSSCSADSTPVQSFDAEATIIKIRNATTSKGGLLIGGAYDGDIVAINSKGKIAWHTKTGVGTMIHDIWCEDIIGDSDAEILAANANGTLYCLDSNGEILWEFSAYNGVHRTPMYAVTVVKDSQHTPYVVCGDYSGNIYYVSGKGKEVKTIHSSKYSNIMPWGEINDRPADKVHNANFLRPLPLQDGSDLLVIHGSNNHMQSTGMLFIMKPLEDKTIYTSEKLNTNHPLGDMRVVKVGDKYQIMYGTSTLNNNTINIVSFSDDTYTKATDQRITVSREYLAGVSYRVNQTFVLPKKDVGFNYTVLTSNQLIFYPEKGGEVAEKTVGTTYSFFDVCPLGEGKIALASSQDGGSGIYIVDTWQEGWEDAFKALEPVGKIAAIKKSFAIVEQNLQNFKKPQWQREPVQVVGCEGIGLPRTDKFSNDAALELLASPWCRGKLQDPSWRLPLYKDNRFLSKRDSRNRYVLTSEESRQQYISSYEGNPGISTWGGHGNDPLYYSKEVLLDVANYGYNNGKKKTIYIWPEMNHHDDDFKFVLDNHIFPIAEHLRKIGGKVGLRAKDVFFQGPIYTPVWERVLSGEFADVMIPMMEETTDKTQDLSLMSRMGLWLSGSVDGWGVRCSRDDSSFDRSRQFSSQKLSNHFLRKTIYSLACGAKYMHNAYMNPYHESLYLEMLDKEALFVPKRDEIVSINPVHISMYSPSDEFIYEAENNKWTSYFDKEKEEQNPKVFSHMNGSWPGGALTPWDYSTFASGIVDRRQNALPPYPHGMVLFTPVQEGPFADIDAPRGKMVDKLHPIYKNILKEYITDGVDYISEDGKQRFKADKFYTQVKKDIEQGAKKLPVVVESLEGGGKAAWVVAQVDPTHLRLTLVDGGFLNPSDSKVKVHFNTIKPIAVRDILDGNTFDYNGSNSVEIDIACGMFRFIDIELSSPLN